MSFKLGANGIFFKQKNLKVKEHVAHNHEKQISASTNGFVLSFALLFFFFPLKLNCLQILNFKLLIVLTETKNLNRFQKTLVKTKAMQSRPSFTS